MRLSFAGASPMRKVLAGNRGAAEPPAWVGGTGAEACTPAVAFLVISIFARNDITEERQRGSARDRQLDPLTP